MQQAPTTFDPNQVPVSLTLSPAQVGLILRGLGKLPLEEVDQFYNGIRTVAQQAIQAAERAFNEQAEAAAKAEASESAAEA